MSEALIYWLQLETFKITNVECFLTKKEEMPTEIPFIENKLYTYLISGKLFIFLNQNFLVLNLPFAEPF
jgi:hypothetical protein